MKATLCLVLLLAAVVTAQPATETPAPKSAAAVAAIAKATAAQHDAAAIYSRAMLNTKQAEITALKTAQKSALTGDNLAEATAIGNLIAGLEAEIASLSNSGAIRFIVKADQPWQSAGTVPAGTYTMEVSGQWRAAPNLPWCGPEGIDSGIKKGSFALLMQVNDATHRPGTKYTVTIPEHATVTFQMADTDLGNNSGQLVVVMTRQADAVLPDK